MKKVNIKFIKHPGKFRLAYHPDETAIMDEKQAADLIKAGVAVPLENNAENSDLPEDLPGRKVFVALNMPLDEVEKITDFEALEGIGKKTAEQLVEYFKTK